MIVAAQTLRSVVRELSEVPNEIAQWATHLSDRTFLQLMFVGAVVLTFVVARALR